MQFFHDPTYDVLVYERLSPLALGHLPEAKQLNGTCVAVPRTLRNSQILRYFGYPVVPIMDSYDWPIEPGRHALEHQKLYSNFQILHPRCFNLGDPGTMKTLSSLWAADWTIQHSKEEFRWLIICPLTIIESGWASAIFKNFLNRRSFEVLHGTPEKRSKLLNKKADFYLINYEGPGIGAHTRHKFELDGFSKELAARDDIKGVIIDEARAYGDASSKRSRLARMIFGDKPYMWQLCGSPTPQAPTDCYGMAKLLNNAFGKSYRTFELETMTKVSNFRWVPKRDGYEKAKQLLTPAVRFALDEIWDGPPQTIQPPAHIEPSDEQKKLLADLKRDLIIQVKSGELISADSESVARLKLLQICAGAIYGGDHKGHLVDSAPRLREIESIIDNTSRKTIIFANFTVIIDMLQKQLMERWRKAKVATRSEILYGDTSRANRAKILQEFGSDPNLKVIIADPGVAAHGVNEFVAADTIIWDGPPDKSDYWNQGNARVRRPGQNYPSTVFQISCSQTEREIFRRLETNTSLQGVMLDSVARGEL